MVWFYQFPFSEKNGCEIEQVCPLVKHVIDNCKNLEFVGLMTIGMFGYDVAKGPNPDFVCLKECKKKVSEELGIDLKDIELSMGMSCDYEHAVLSVGIAFVHFFLFWYVK